MVMYTVVVADCALAKRGKSEETKLAAKHSYVEDVFFIVIDIINAMILL